MKILVTASEVAPLVKTGGLADAAGALAQTLHVLGQEVSVVLPKYASVNVESNKVADLSVQVGDEVYEGSIEASQLPEYGIPLYLISQEHFFNRAGIYNENGQDYDDNLARYTFFCRGVIELLSQKITQPDLIHCNDWQTALVPIYLKTLFGGNAYLSAMKTLYSIHNLAYQGLFPADEFPQTGLGWEHFHMEELEFYNQVNLMKGGIIFADAVCTVSPTYAQEIQTDEFGCGLVGVLQNRKDSLTGILNGVDYSVWSPENDRMIPQSYTVDTVVDGKAANKKALREFFALSNDHPELPLFGVVSRLAEQKGLDLAVPVIEKLAETGCQLALIGSGDPPLEQAFRDLQSRFPNQCGVRITYDEKIAHLIEAGADLFLMPSRYEPCGLNQMYSLRYGTIPVVNHTGGLADTIRDCGDFADGNGFVFHEPSAEALLEACQRALVKFRSRDEWLALVRRAMKCDFSWKVSGQQYVELYTKIRNGG